MLKIPPISTHKMQTILPEEQYLVLYRISWLALVSCMYALYMGHHTLAIVPGSVFLNSVNYWRKPDYSWRRYLDMSNAVSMGVYQYYMAYGAQYGIAYYVISGLGASMYPVGVYYYKKGDTWTSVYFHGLFHVLCNIANVILYSGYITAPVPEI